MPITTTPVHQATAATSAVTITAAASGNSLIVCVASQRSPAARTVSSIACTNTTFVKGGSAASSTLDCEIWIGSVAGGSSGTTVTLTMSGTGWALAVTVSEWNGVFTPSSGATDGTADGVAETATGSAASFGNGTYNNLSGDLLIGAVATPNATGATFTNMTALTGVSSTTVDSIAAAYVVPASAGQANGGSPCSWTTTNGVAVVSLIVGFKPAPKTQALTGVAFTGLAAWAPSFSKLHAFGKTLPGVAFTGAAAWAPTINRKNNRSSVTTSPVAHETASSSQGFITGIQGLNWAAFSFLAASTYTLTGIDLIIEGAGAFTGGLTGLPLSLSVRSFINGSDLSTLAVPWDPGAVNGTDRVSFVVTPVALSINITYFVVIGWPGYAGPQNIGFPYNNAAGSNSIYSSTSGPTGLSLLLASQTVSGYTMYSGVLPAALSAAQSATITSKRGKNFPAAIAAFAASLLKGIRFVAKTVAMNYTVADSYLDPVVAPSGSVEPGAQWAGFYFVASSSYTLRAMHLWLCNSGGTPGPVQWRIKASSGGIPSGAILTSGTFDGNAVDSGSDGKEFEIVVNYALTGSQEYTFMWQPLVYSLYKDPGNDNETLSSDAAGITGWATGWSRSFPFVALTGSSPLLRGKLFTGVATAAYAGSLLKGRMLSASLAAWTAILDTVYQAAGVGSAHFQSLTAATLAMGASLIKQARKFFTGS